MNDQEPWTGPDSCDLPVVASTGENCVDDAPGWRVLTRVNRLRLRIRLRHGDIDLENNVLRLRASQPEPSIHFEKRAIWTGASWLIGQM